MLNAGNDDAHAAWIGGIGEMVVELALGVVVEGDETLGEEFAGVLDAMGFACVRRVVLECSHAWDGWRRGEGGDKRTDLCILQSSLGGNGV